MCTLYTHVHTCIKTCAHTHAYTHTRARAHTHTHTRNTRTHTHTHTHTHACTHTRTHTHAHTHTHRVNLSTFCYCITENEVKPWSNVTQFKSWSDCQAHERFTYCPTDSSHTPYHICDNASSKSRKYGRLSGMYSRGQARMQQIKKEETFCS